MHKNTAITIVFLSIIAALLIGLNIGRKLSGTTDEQITLLPSPTTTLVEASPQPEGDVAGTTSKTFISEACGVRFAYPDNYQLIEASNAASLANPQSQEKIYMVCQTNVERPLLSDDRTDTTTIAGQLTKIYHDQDADTKQKIDYVVLTQPKLNLEIAFMGFGKVFDALLQTVKILE